jgi:hypothetical protein
MQSVQSLHRLCTGFRPFSSSTKEDRALYAVRTTDLAHLAVAPERESVVPLPSLPPASSCLVVPVTLAQPTALLAGCREATALAVLVHGFGDPVDAWVTADSLVLGINEDDLVVLVGRVLVDPVRVENA